MLSSGGKLSRMHVDPQERLFHLGAVGVEQELDRLAEIRACLV